MEKSARTKPGDQTRLGNGTFTENCRWSNSVNRALERLNRLRTIHLPLVWLGGGSKAGHRQDFSPAAGNDARSGVLAPHPRCWQGLKARKNDSPNPMWGMNG
jgi:hypothetical protein